MKILKIEIRNNEKIVRNINFLENDSFFVYGDVEQPKNKRKTSNSIGKTIVLKLCDYIYGCKCDPELSNSVVGNYEICASISFNGANHIIKRKLNQSSIILDGVDTTIQKYHNMFNIDRNYISRQLQLQSKGSILGYTKNASQYDYVSFLNLLNLSDIAKLVDEFYTIRTELSTLEETKHKLLTINKMSDKKLSECIFINKKRIDELNDQIEMIKRNISTLEIGQNSSDCLKEYNSTNYKLKETQSLISKLDYEGKCLSAFIDESKNMNISVKSIKTIYEKAKIEIPEMVIRNLIDVEKFYNSILRDRLNNINRRLEDIKINIQVFENTKLFYIKKLDSLGKMIANNEAYQRAFNLLNENNKVLLDLKHEEGLLDQISKVIFEIKNLTNKIVEDHNKIESLINEKFNLINEYREFIYKIVKDIYSDEVAAYFDVYTSEYKKGSIPIHIDLSISGETGEGISEVKKNIIDILIFRFNRFSDMLILDSSCFNGIDPRQVSGLLKIIKVICNTFKKQAIIAINKYQLDSDFVETNINKNNCLKLSENNKLFKLSF